MLLRPGAGLLRLEEFAGEKKGLDPALVVLGRGTARGQAGTLAQEVEVLKSGHASESSAAAPVAVAYLRVSTSEQHLGIEAQRHELSRWSEREGIVIVGWHQDQGVSGARRWDRRPGLRAALDQAQRERALLVVAKRDRLGRGIEVMVGVEAELRRRRIVLRSCAGEGTDGTSSAHQLQRGILDAVSGFELSRLSERIQAAIAVKRRQGRPYSGTPPFGWRRVEGSDGPRLVPEPREQAARAFVLELRERGRSLRAIVRAAQRAGHLTRSGDPFSLSLVQSILKPRDLPPLEAPGENAPRP